MIAAIVFALLLAQGQVIEAAKAAIQGVVVDSTTQSPIGGAHVLLTSNQPAEGKKSATTNDRGRFAFDGLEVGSYRLAFEVNGYVRQELGQRVFPGEGSSIPLAKGQSRDVQMAMTPTGSVSGRIREKDRQPLAGVPVRLLRYAYDSVGQRILRSVGEEAVTNDRGEYRLYYVTPGRYFLNAGSPQALGIYDGTVPGPNEVREAYANTYYPGVRDIRLATVVDVQPAVPISGVDLTMSVQELFHVRGRVVDGALSETGGPVQPPGARSNTVNLGLSSPTTEYWNTSSIINPDAVFDFSGKAPGVYTLLGEIRAPDETELPHLGTTVGLRGADTRIVSTGYLSIEVVDADVDGLVLQLHPAGRVTGRLIFTSPYPPSQSVLSAPWVSLQATGLGAYHARPESDRPFYIAGLGSGEYRLSVSGLKPGYYVKEARFDGKDALNEPLQYDGLDTSVLEVTIASIENTVEGAITNDKLEPAAGATVVIAPDRNRNRADLFKVAVTDQHGYFSIANVPPGDYRVFAWEALEPYAFFDPEVLTAAFPRSVPIHPSELSKETVTIKVPAQ